LAERAESELEWGSKAVSTASASQSHRLVAFIASSSDIWNGTGPCPRKACTASATFTSALNRERSSIAGAAGSIVVVSAGSAAASIVLNRGSSNADNTAAVAAVEAATAFRVSRSITSA
jgi:hypothetical protein